MKHLLMLACFCGVLEAGECLPAGHHSTSACDPKADLRYNRSKGYWERRVNGVWAAQSSSPQCEKPVTAAPTQRLPVRSASPRIREERYVDDRAEIEMILMARGKGEWIYWEGCKITRNSDRKYVIGGGRKETVLFEFRLAPNGNTRHQVKQIRIEYDKDSYKHKVECFGDD